MKRMNSTSNLRTKATIVSEHNILDEEKPRSRAPPKPPRTFSRVRAEKSTQSKTSDVSNNGFNDSFDEDIAENITALLGKSFERLEITPTSQPSPSESKCLREWVLRMCLLEKLEKTAIAMETEELGACELREDNPGWLGPKLVELMEPPRKRRKFCSKFFRNLSPSRLLLRQKQKEEKRKARRQQREKRECQDKMASVAEDKNRTFNTDRCRMNLSKVPDFFIKTFWKDGKKHTEL